MKAAVVLVLTFAVVAGAAGAALYQVFATPQAQGLTSDAKPEVTALDRERARAADLSAEVTRLTADLELERKLNEDLRARLQTAETVAAAVDTAEEGAEVVESVEAPSGDETSERQRRGGRGGRGGWNEELTEEQVLTMLSSESRFERMQALRNLDKLSDRSRAFEIALAELEGAEGRGRFMAIDALIRLGGPEAAAALAKILPDEDGWGQVRIARALAEIGDVSALPAMQSAFAGADGREQVGLALALRDMGDSSGVGQVGSQAIADLSNADGSRREDAVRTLGSLQDPAQNVHLVGALNDSNSDVRVAALTALARQGTSSEIGAVMDLSSDPTPEVARAAQRAVEMIQDPTLRQRESQRGGGFGGFGGFGGGGRGR